MEQSRSVPAVVHGSCGNQDLDYASSDGTYLYIQKVVCRMNGFNSVHTSDR